jgi:hypothetical protein
MNTQPAFNRRRFIGAAGLVAGSMITRPLFGADAPSNKLNVALIGVWGRGLAHYNILDQENVVALCDVNEERFPEALKRFPDMMPGILFVDTARRPPMIPPP